MPPVTSGAAPSPMVTAWRATTSLVISGALLAAPAPAHSQPVASQSARQPPSQPPVPPPIVPPPIAPPPPAPPPIASASPHAASPPASALARSLVSWTPGTVRCAEGEAIARPPRRPLGQLIWSAAPGAYRPEIYQPVPWHFAIDATGRTLGIARSVPAMTLPHADLGATLAATRFAPGAPRTGCTITYTPHVTALGEAPVADLISYTMSPDNGPLPPEGWARIRQQGTCNDPPPPAPLQRVFPDFRSLPGTPGVKDWAAVDYDLDAKGQPRNARVSHGTGNTALDAAATRAVTQSRFTPGARTGCRYPYWRAPATIPAPPAPDPASFAPDPASVADAAATCARPYSYATAPRLTYPAAYRRRRIEGWAILRFDVAPWGDIGNATVLAAEPTADFGTHALQVLRTARFQPAPAGRSGCVETVRFTMDADGAPDEAGASPATG